MRVIPPVPITPAKLISSTAADVHAPAAYALGTTYAYGAVVSVPADFAIYESLQESNTGNTPALEPLWWRKIGATETTYSTGTTYALGATVSYGQRVYESLQATNIGKQPPIPPETQTAWWVDVGPTNKWATFDFNNNTQTVAASPLTIVFTPGMRVNSIGVSGMVANKVTITGASVNGGGVVFGPIVTDLNLRSVVNAYDYAFNRFLTQPSLVHFNVPPFFDIVFTVTLEATSGNIKCGSIIVGTYVDLGNVQYGAQGGALNFSSIDRDIYGNATLVPRRSVPKVNVTTVLDKAKVNSVRSARAELNATSALWVGIDDGSSEWFDMLLVHGIYKTFEIDASEHQHATITLEIEEL